MSKHKKHMILWADNEEFVTVCGLKSSGHTESFIEGDNFVEFGDTQATCMHCKRKFAKSLAQHDDWVGQKYTPKVEKQKKRLGISIIFVVLSIAIGVTLGFMGRLLPKGTDIIIGVALILIVIFINRAKK
jgi:hypothetical protein